MTWDAMVRDLLVRARADAGLTYRALALRMTLDHRCPVDGRTLRRIIAGDARPQGKYIDPWLAACGWDAEIVAWRVEEKLKA